MMQQEDRAVLFKDLKIASGSKLSKVSQFMYFSASTNYHIEVHEYLGSASSLFVGYIESSSDRSRKFPPANAVSLGECLQKLIDEVSPGSAESPQAV